MKDFIIVFNTERRDIMKPMRRCDVIIIRVQGVSNSPTGILMTSCDHMLHMPDLNGLPRKTCLLRNGKHREEERLCFIREAAILLPRSDHFAPVVGRCSTDSADMLGTTPGLRAHDLSRQRHIFYPRSRCREYPLWSMALDSCVCNPCSTSHPYSLRKWP